MPRSFAAAVAPLLIPALLSMVAVSTSVAQTPWPTERWPGTTPEVVGLSSATLDSIDAEIRAGEYGYVDRFLVIRNGQVAYDRRYHNDYDHIYGDSARIGTLFLNHHRAGPYNYFNPWWHPYYRRGDLHTLQSVTKTITSIVIGAAVNRDEFPSLDTPVLSFFDSGTVANVDDRKRRMTVRHLLTMTAGVDWNEDETVDHLESSYDWVRFTIDRPMADEPGTRFNYNSGASQLLSHIFREALGSDIEEYAARHLFAPLGITDWFWKRTPAGLPDTEGGLYLTSEDLAKLWFLFLRDGIWDGQEVVSPEWVRASVAPAMAVDDPSRPNGVHYGLKWWLHPNPTDSTRFMWLGSGFGGQFPIAIPEQDLIVVINQWNILPSGPWLIPEPIVARILRGLTDSRRSYFIPSAAPDVPDTVHVALPTSDTETDRASILAALDEVEPGGMVLFGSGTYLVGEIISVPQPGITLQAHPNGTTLRGCKPGEAGESVLSCGVMRLQGGGVTVRGFTIEQSHLGVCISICRSDPQAPIGDTVGGYRIVDNTFRNSLNGVRGQVVASDTSFIRDNRFINTFHAVSFLEASNLHVIDNRISAPEPEEMPGLGHVSFAIAVGGSSNLIARNRTEGHPDGILLAASPGGRASGNVIRENTIAVARNRLPTGGSPALASSDPADSTIVGVPLALHGLRAARATTEAGRVSDNLVEDNRILGAEGIGIELSRASGNRIVGNEVFGIVPRRPFPGNSVSTDPEPWREANGSGIWVSPGSDGNEIIGNRFENIASHAVVLEGDSNHVEVRTDADAVRDLGTGNRVDAPGTTTRHPELAEVAYESKFVQVRGIRMHYLDFGGSGLPVIFLHGGHGDARNFVDFASRFVDGFRVLALDRRGKGQSEKVDWGYGPAAQAEDVLGFMDALGLERAVLIGNVGAPVAMMTYLAEHHPDRLAGVAYLAHEAPTIDSHRDSAVAEFWDMAIGTACDWGDEEQRRRETQRHGYRPHFIDDPELRIDVPALSFANADGTRYPEDFDVVGLFLQGGATREWCDPVANEYFSALAADTAKVDELRSRLGDGSGAVHVAAFERAFGPYLRVVRLDVPIVTGYETERSPDLIYPHIRRFLEGLKEPREDGGEP